jgi:hypothetical protein
MGEGNMSLDDSAVTVNWRQTNPTERIELAQYAGFKDNQPIPWLLTYDQLFRSLAKPDPAVHQKDGRSFLIGPCSGRRIGSNIPYGSVAVIDADSSITEEQKIVIGAPPPIQVHDALVSWNISHCLYTTFSHGTDKGNRYRIVIPARVENVRELRALVTYVVSLLQEHAGFPLALSRESFVWNQGWALPRVRYEGAEFLFLSHMGATPSPADLASVYQFNERETKLPPDLHPGQAQENSPIAIVAKCMPITWSLQQHGYTYVSQGSMLDQTGREVPVLRYRKPGSTSAPGVVVFQDGDRWKCYSHHQGDPLANGHCNDAFDVYMLLNDFSNPTEALLSALPVIQEQINEDLNREYPSVMEAGMKFKYGNIYVDEFEALQYRLLDQSAFQAMLRNQAKVPVAGTTDTGEKVIRMVDVGKYWEECPERVVYNGVLYYPTPLAEKPKLAVEKEGKPYFNLFRSWHLTPCRGRWDKMDWHMKHALCGGDEEQYEYLLNWFAHLFQFPNEKAGVAVVLKGGRGWGKSIVFSEIGRKLGTHSFVAGNNRLLTGNFNSHLRNKMLLVVEESFWSGSPRDRGILQHLITDQVTAFEKKSFDAEAGLSYLRVAMISNEDWVAPAAGDERRYFIPTTSPISKEKDIVNGDKGFFFPSLLAEMRGGGIEAFAYDMMNRPIQPDCIKRVPQTDELYTQKELSMDWIDNWIRHALMERKISSRELGAVPWTEMGCKIPTDLIQASLKDISPNSTAYSDKGLLTTFGVRMKKVFRNNEVRRVSDPVGTFYRFPSLSASREIFEHYAGFPIQWPSDGSDMPRFEGVSEYASVQRH